MNNIRSRIFIALIFFLSCFTVAAQEQVSRDSSIIVPMDSTPMKLREFDKSTLEELKSNPELDYGYGPAALSWWERFKRWLASLLSNVMNAAAEARWVEILIYVVAAVALAYVILRLLKIDALKMFYGTPAAPIHAEGIEDNIHEMDFDALLSDAVAKGNYRLAIRLLFLHSLKILSDKQMIQWEPGKTNHDYLNELNSGQTKSGFDRLNYYFEYAWYGNFHIAPELFGKVRDTFNRWRSNV